jgi:hypothetical protein
MNTPPESADLEEITRFLHRFADLMSNGSNAENLLRAAKLLEANVKRATEAESALRQERSNCANLESGIADLKSQLTTIQGGLSQGTHVLAPVSILRLAASQFESLAGAFEKSGNVVSQAMCEASASTLTRVFEADTPRNAAFAQPRLSKI